MALLSLQLQVFPFQYRQVISKWSAITSYNAFEKPYSAAVINSPSVPSCVSMPQQPLINGSSSFPRKQVALICSFDLSTTASRTAYLVRILSDGSRLPVDPVNHISPTLYAAVPGKALLYDVAFNIIYWTVFQTWNAAYGQDTEKRTIYRVLLDPEYNISLVDYSGPAFDAPPPSAASSVEHPLGISLEAASMEPSDGGMLYVYLCRLGSEAKLYKIPVLQMESGGGAARSRQILPLEESNDGPALSSIERMASATCRLPAKFFFTLHGRLFVQRPFYGANLPGADDISIVGNCQRCPYGLTSVAGKATSVDMCRYSIGMLCSCFFH